MASFAPLFAFAEWLLPGDEDGPSPPEGYVVSFALFHERGFTVPAHTFLRGLLDYYQVELQHLTPNGSNIWRRLSPCVGAS